jgi:hypothetical protein
LLGNSIALPATTHVTYLLGYVFWTVCARGVSPGASGLTNTVIGKIDRAAVRRQLEEQVAPDLVAAEHGSEL